MPWPGDTVPNSAFLRESVPLSYLSGCQSGPYCILKTAQYSLQKKLPNHRIVQELLKLLYEPAFPNPDVLHGLISFTDRDEDCESNMNQLRRLARAFFQFHRGAVSPPEAISCDDEKSAIRGNEVTFRWMQAAAVAIGARLNIYFPSNNDGEYLCVTAMPMHGSTDILGACNVLFSVDTKLFSPLFPLVGPPSYDIASNIDATIESLIETRTVGPASSCFYSIEVLGSAIEGTNLRLPHIIRVKMGKYIFVAKYMQGLDIAGKWQEAIKIAEPYGIGTRPTVRFLADDSYKSFTPGFCTCLRKDCKQNLCITDE